MNLRSSSTLSHPRYRSDIDGLRAIAVVSVILFHAFPSQFNGGFVGVDIFFVISGFLISTIIFKNLEQETFSFGEFYSRRIKRIFPALIVVLSLCYCIGWFTLLADEFKQLSKHIFGGSAFISNFLFWREAGYFDNAADTKPLLHLWSLGIEEQFYILWPLMLWTAWRLKLKFIFIVAISIATSFTFNISNIQIDPVAGFYLPHARIWELLLGSLLALYKSADNLTALNAKEKLIHNLASALGFVFLIYSLATITKDSAFPGYLALLPTLGAALIIFSGNDTFLNQKLLSHRVLVWLGLISFPLYLWHWPILSFARIIEGETPSFGIRIAAILLSTVLAWLTFRFVEKPVRASRRKPVTLILLIGLMSCIGVIALYSFLNDGIKQRQFHMHNDNSNAFDWPESKYISSECIEKISIAGIAYCRMSYSQSPTVALVGDSHANAIFDFFDLYFTPKKISAVVLGKTGCPPFLDIERGNNGCAATMEGIVNYINSNPQINKVFLTGRFAAAESGTNFGGERFQDSYKLSQISNPEVTDRQQIFKHGLEKMIMSLLAHKKDVTILLDTPELNFDPKSCLGARNKKPCSINMPTVKTRQDGYTKIILDLQRIHNFRVIDLKDSICDTEKCNAKFAGKILYRDSHHLGIEGNKFLFEQGARLE